MTLGRIVSRGLIPLSVFALLGSGLVLHDPMAEVNASVRTADVAGTPAEVRDTVVETVAPDEQTPTDPQTAPEGDVVPEGEKAPEGETTPEPDEPETLAAPEDQQNLDEGHGEEGHVHVTDGVVVAELEPRDLESFSMLGVTWSSGLDATTSRVEARWRTDGTWSEWTELHVEPSTEGVPGTEPQWVGQADAAAVRMISTSGAQPQDVALSTVDPGETPDVAPAALATASTAGVPKPRIISRASWGASGGSRCDSSRPGATMKGVVVHHTAGSNNYSKSQSASIVKATQAYHTGSRAWCDIGYNFLVDKYGQIFEGRAGGVDKPVRAAHSGNGPVNEDTSGISMMGTFTSTAPSTALKSAVDDLAAWKLAVHNLPATGTFTSGGKRLNRISAHRNVVATACPGAAAYSWVTSSGGMRPAVARRIAAGGGVASGGSDYRWKAPTSFKASSATSSTVNVSWAAQAGAAKYVVKISPNSNMSSAGYRAFSTNSGTISGLKPGTTYYMQVIVKHSKTNEELSPYSARITGSTYRWAAPAQLKASSATSSTVNVSWAAQAGAAKYVVKISPNSNMSSAGYRAFSTNSGTISGLKPGTTYYMQVIVKHSKTNEELSPYSARVTSKTTAVAPAAPINDGYRWKAPTSLKASGATASTLNASWAAQAGAAKYVVKISRSSSMAGAGFRAFTRNSGTISGLKPGTTYYMQVIIKHSKTNEALSSYSSKITARTTAASANSVNSRTVGSATSVNFSGHGFGHGIGMSQYGARGGALQGKRASQILATYYSGTKIETSARYIRVLVGADNDGSTAVVGQSGLRFLQGSTSLALPTSVSGRAVSFWRIEPSSSDQRRSILRYKSGSTWRTYNNMSWSGSADFAATTMRLALPGGGTTTYRYKIRAAQPSSSSTTRRTVNVLNLNDYTRGVIAREVPASWPTEALRSQAIAARTYGLRSIKSGGYYDICDTTSCQVYGGASAEDSRTNGAVASTSNMVLTYNGSPALTQFSSSSGGFTSAGSQPYLKAVNDPWDGASGNPNHDWSQSVSVSAIERANPSIGSLRKLEVVKRNGHGEMGGRVVSLKLTGSKGTATMSGSVARFAFGLKSDWFGF